RLRECLRDYLAYSRLSLIFSRPSMIALLTLLKPFLLQPKVFWILRQALETFLSGSRMLLSPLVRFRPLSMVFRGYAILHLMLLTVLLARLSRFRIRLLSSSIRSILW